MQRGGGRSEVLRWNKDVDGQILQCSPPHWLRLESSDGRWESMVHGPRMCQRVPWAQPPSPSWRAKISLNPPEISTHDTRARRFLSSSSQHCLLLASESTALSIAHTCLINFSTAARAIACPHARYRTRNRTKACSCLCSCH